MGHEAAVAFQGRRVWYTADADSYITPKGGIVFSVPGAISGAVQIYESFAELADSYEPHPAR